MSDESAVRKVSYSGRNYYFVCFRIKIFACLINYLFCSFNYPGVIFSLCGEGVKGNNCSVVRVDVFFKEI